MIGKNAKPSILEYQRHWQTDFAALSAGALKSIQLFELIFVKVWQRFMLFEISQPFFASVARNIFFSVGECVYGKGTVISAAVADRRF